MVGPRSGTELSASGGVGLVFAHGRWWAGEGQREAKRSAAARAVLGPDLSTVGCDDATTDGEAQAGPAGGPDIFMLAGTNHHGERFAQVMLDCLATGAGAYSHHDGVWTQGQHNIEREVISNTMAGG